MSELKESNLVAVYGSLRRGLGNHGFLRESNLLSTEQVSGFLMKSLGGYPAVFHDDPDKVITIEVYEVPEKSMRGLDSLEGHPAWYRRELIETSQGEAWIYVMQREYQRPVVESGDWVQYLENNQFRRAI
jgi:gamma-glutamylcyclotransferase (GGCT)/AIG2-like uncharacterized protein YtfP